MPGDVVLGCGVVCGRGILVETRLCIHPHHHTTPNGLNQSKKPSTHPHHTFTTLLPPPPPPKKNPKKQEDAHRPKNRRKELRLGVSKGCGARTGRCLQLSSSPCSRRQRPAQACSRLAERIHLVCVK